MSDTVERKRGPRRQTRMPFDDLEQWLYERYGPDPVILEQTSVFNENSRNPIADGRRWTDGRVALYCNTNRYQVYRWRHEGGITYKYADRVAIEAGCHPLNIWPNYYSIDPEES